MVKTYGIAIEDFGVTALCASIVSIGAATFGGFSFRPGRRLDMITERVARAFIVLALIFFGTMFYADGVAGVENLRHSAGYCFVGTSAEREDHEHSSIPLVRADEFLFGSPQPTPWR
jgi:hypothetical protein